MPAPAKTGAQRVEPLGRVVVAGHDHDVGAGGPQRQERRPGQPLGLRPRCRRLEDVAGDEHRVDGLALGERHDLGQHLALLAEALDALQHLPDVPVGGVEELHDNPANGSSTSPA